MTTTTTDELRTLAFTTLLALTGVEAIRTRYEALRDGAYGPLDDSDDRDTVEAVGEALRVIEALAGGHATDTTVPVAWLRRCHVEAGARIRRNLPDGQREARPDETCSCGLRAVVVYETARFGDVPHCGGHGGAA